MDQGADVLRADDSSPFLSGLESFKWQQSTFSILNLIALSTLLLIHIFFANHFGMPTPTLVLLLGAAFLMRAAELIWVQSRTSLPSPSRVRALSLASVILNLALAFVAAMLTNRPDAQYFVLLVMPVIEAAFSFSLLTTSMIIVTAGVLNFLWIVDYATHQRGPIQPSEYFEASTISLIYALVGILVWMLVNDLRRNQEALSKNISELKQTRERLVMEEKLGAVGRLASAIAHEIRNPVAMISSSLATAARVTLDAEQRDAMYGIAAQEATRLEQLTNDFLAYARPRPPVKTVNNASDLLMYVADLSRANAESKHINLIVDAPELVLCECDPSGLQQALLNLVMNAVDACPQNETVTLTAAKVGESVLIEIRNPSNGIAPDVSTRIFEPFFTTKAHGTGLGLAIARNVARNQGGDVTLTINGPEHVVFSMRMPAAAEAEVEAGRI
jgi:signal transduction histidine kinase